MANLNKVQTSLISFLSNLVKIVSISYSGSQVTVEHEKGVSIFPGTIVEASVRKTLNANGWKEFGLNNYKRVSKDVPIEGMVERKTSAALKVHKALTPAEQLLATSTAIAMASKEIPVTPVSEISPLTALQGTFDDILLDIEDCGDPKSRQDYRVLLAECLAYQLAGQAKYAAEVSPSAKWKREVKDKVIDFSQFYANTTALLRFDVVERVNIIAKKEAKLKADAKHFEPSLGKMMSITDVMKHFSPEQKEAITQQVEADQEAKRERVMQMTVTAEVAMVRVQTGAVRIQMPMALNVAWALESLITFATKDFIRNGVKMLELAQSILDSRGTGEEALAAQFIRKNELTAMCGTAELTKDIMATWALYLPELKKMAVALSARDDGSEAADDLAAQALKHAGFALEEDGVIGGQSDQNDRS